MSTASTSYELSRSGSSRRSVPVEEGVEEGRPATPLPRSVARPPAVLLPPLAALCLVLLGSVGGQLLLGSGSAVLAGGFGVVMLATLYLLRATLIGAEQRDVLTLASVAAGLLLYALTAALGGLWLVHPLTAVVTFSIAGVAVTLAPKWRAHLVAVRRVPITLLAGTELAAQAALTRLEALHAFDVVSLLVPGAEDVPGRRLVDRPLASKPSGDLTLQRRIVVSCPARDERVGAYVAQLVARGHEILSESAVVRRVEGRVDSRQADPLGLLMSLPNAPVAEAARVALSSASALLLLALFSPILLSIAVAVMLESGLPVFYRQTRLGRRGQPFQVVKFRTMRQNAEDLSGPVFATEADPRMTRVGRFLRTYRLDELPQLWNVVRGEMALVGPRPERPHFFDLFREDIPLFELRTCVRPGITGWSQVQLPYASDAGDARVKLEHDLFYLTRRGWLFHLAILVDTVHVALSGAGAR